MNYYTALVRNSTIDYDAEVIKVDVWPIRAYSVVEHEGFSSSVAYVDSLPDSHRERHIPLPCVQRKGVPIAATLKSFGWPLRVRAPRGSCPKWVLLEPQVVSLGLSTSVSIIPLTVPRRTVY